MMTRCDGCKFWNRDEGSDYAGGLGICERVHPFWDRSEWNPAYEDTYTGPRRVLVESAKDDMMFCQDMSDCSAILLTKAEFFCAHHEAKIIE